MQGFVHEEACCSVPTCRIHENCTERTILRDRSAVALEELGIIVATFRVAN